MRAAVTVGVVLCLVGCGSSERSVTVGSQASCDHRLSALIDADYLREHDIGIRNPQAARILLAGHIAGVCHDIDPQTSVDDAAQKVVDSIRADL